MKPRRPPLKPAEIALFTAPVLVLLLALAVVQLRPLLAGKGPGRVKGFSIDCVSFSPDGATLATGDTAGAIRWWDARTGLPKRTLQARGGWCICHAFTPDGKYFLATSGNSLLTFDARTGTQIRAVTGPLLEMGALAISPNSKLVAVGVDDIRGYHGVGQIRVFDIATGQQVKNLGIAIGMVASLGFSPDSKLLISYSGADRRVITDFSAADVLQLFDVPTGQLKWEAGAGSLGAARFAPDGRRIAVGEFQPKLRDVKTSKTLVTTKVPDDGEGAWYLWFLAHGQVLAGTSESHQESLTFWDTATGEALEPPTVKSGALGERADAFAFSNDEKRCAYFDSNGKIQMWDTSGFKMESVLDDPSVLTKAKRMWVLEPLGGGRE